MRWMIGLLVLVGSAAQAQSPDVEALVEAAREVEETPEVTAEDAVVPAAREVLEGKPARTIVSGVSVRHPYGQGQPVVTCAPLHACALELQAGEDLVGVALGDSERWMTAPLEGGPRQYLVVKPTGWDLATNLIVTTSRRTYHVELRSPREGTDATYDQVVGWWYPQEIVRSFEAHTRAARAEETSRSALTLAPLSVPLSAIDADRYRIGGARVSWRPELVFDDGAHTYLRFPADLGSRSAPAVLATTDAGSEAAVVNHRVLPGGRWWVVDGVFPEVHLVQGSGRKARRVEITNRAYER